MERLYGIAGLLFSVGFGVLFGEPIGIVSRFPYWEVVAFACIGLSVVAVVIAELALARKRTRLASAEDGGDRAQLVLAKADAEAELPRQEYFLSVAAHYIDQPGSHVRHEELTGIVAQLKARIAATDAEIKRLDARRGR